mgnify:FL=1|jgi:hypothetical protein
MGEIINFNKDSEELADLEVEIKITEDGKAKLIEASNFINGLSLGRTDNDKLIALLTSTTNQVMKDAFLQGFELGVKVTKEG